MFLWSAPVKKLFLYFVPIKILEDRNPREGGQNIYNILKMNGG